MINYVLDTKEGVNMNATAFKNACYTFAKKTAPYLDIRDEKHYHECLELIESLMQDIGDNANNPLNGIVDLLSQSIEKYENQDKSLVRFENAAMKKTNGLAALRLLIDQHQLTLSDLPEIGSKSMVSRVLSEERDLSKKHIEKLSERFNINPSLFF